MNRLLLLLLSAPLAVQADPTPQNPRRTPVVEVFEKTHGAVANISSTRIVTVRRSISIFDQFFQDFDDMFAPRVRQYKSQGVGSGFVIHPSGYVVTNAHVVARTSDIKISFDDEKTYEAELVAIDHDHDLALLKIEPRALLDVIELGSSADLMIGETVIAIGNPLGYQHTLTTGVVSATNRDLELTDPKTDQTVVYANLIQTDAPINPGNSGGPLLNVLGALIGINTAIRGDAQNIGFAIPVDTLKQVLPVMLSNEQNNRFYFGAEVDSACRVIRVGEGSPAESAGLLVGDVIQRVNHTPVSTDFDLHFTMIGHAPGDRIELQCTRGQQPVRFRILLQEPPKPDGNQLAWEKLGIRLRPLTRAEALQMRVPLDAGLLVTEVASRGPADKIRMRAGDILTFLGRYHVTGLDEVGQLLEPTSAGERAYLEILRLEGTSLYRDGAYLTVR